ncbi:MAG: Mrp/NBP35 family ATP-binding protein [Parachlamydiaceae bacterium]|nr:Mrp/NBP35 family ATP-binding protein [Parachlamydiaceae bacterium]
MPLKMFDSKKKAAPLSSIKNIVAIAAGKGGVGKSTVTVNLALALQRSGYSVGIMDTDIYGPSIRKMLPEDILPGQNGEILIPAICQGIKMISMAYFRKENEAAAVRAPIANGIIIQFIKTVQWGELDFLLIDFPPGTGDIQLTLAQQANLNGAILVTTPQEVALLDVRKAANLFSQVKVPVIGIVENMSYYQKDADSEKVYLFGQGGGERLAQEMKVSLLGSIPVDSAISRCGDEGKSLFSESEYSSGGVQAFFDLAKTFLKQMVSDKERSSNELGSFEIIWKEMP